MTYDMAREGQDVSLGMLPTATLASMLRCVPPRFFSGHLSQVQILSGRRRSHSQAERNKTESTVSDSERAERIL